MLNENINLTNNSNSGNGKSRILKKLFKNVYIENFEYTLKDAGHIQMSLLHEYAYTFEKSISSKVAIKYWEPIKSTKQYLFSEELPENLMIASFKNGMINDHDAGYSVECFNKDSKEQSSSICYINFKKKSFVDSLKFALSKRGIDTKKEFLLKSGMLSNTKGCCCTAKFRNTKFYISLYIIEHSCKNTTMDELVIDLKFIEGSPLMFLKAKKYITKKYLIPYKKLNGYEVKKELEKLE